MGEVIEKRCFKCGEVKALSCFYKHKQMLDGHLNKCKECAKSDSTLNRNANIESVRAYDRCRGNRQGREYCAVYRKNNPNKYKAHTLLNSAVKCGRVVKGSCECGCGKRVVAHHDDYLKPLEVRWMCQATHKQWHRDNGEGKNG